MSPRSLVGMTMGARKRAARRAAISALRVISADTYWYARRRYRIGERLRPCPFCPRIRAICPDCDGSGVLPAKRARP